MTDTQKPGLLRRIVHAPDFRYVLLYGVIGGLAAVIDLLVFALMYHILPIDDVTRKFVANIISMHCGFVFAFTMNTLVNFKKSDKLLRRLISYYAIVLVGLGISSLILNYGTPAADAALAGIGTHGQHVLLVKIFAMGFVSVVQYFLNRFITYRF